MANDIDMWNDIQEIEKSIDRNGDSKEIKEAEEEAELLMECYIYRFQEDDFVKATELKYKFEETYNYWGNYY